MNGYPSPACITNWSECGYGDGLRRHYTLVPCSSVHVVEVWYWIVCHLCERYWRVEYSYHCFHMCMQKYYYGYQLRERKVYCTCCKYACFESSSVMCTYRIDKSYKHDHYQLLSSSAGQRRDKMEIHLPPHQGVCPTQRYGTGCHGYQPLWITPLPTVIVS